MALRRYIALLGLASMAVIPAANATLGENIVTAGEGRLQAKVPLRTQPALGFSIYETRNDFGTTIREYADITGKVFAVTWSGPLMPDLRQLLGPYFPQYAANDGDRKGGHSHRTVRQEDLIVHSSGRMRAFSGKAYLASAVPTGVIIDDLQ